MARDIIHGYKITHTYPNITQEENEKLLKEMLLELHSIFSNKLTEKKIVSL